MRRPLVVRPGDRVRFDGKVHTVVGISGVLVRLADEHGQSSAMHLPTLMTSPGFEVIGSGGVCRLAPGLLDGLPPGEADRALWWHRHMCEVLTGMPPDASAGAIPRPEYDPATRNLAEREAAKAVELSRETGRPASPHTIRWRRRYQKRGVMGMVDGRQAPRRPVLGLLPSLQPAGGWTPHDRLGPHPSLSGQPARRGFRPGHGHGRPGELMEIDSTPFDVLIRLENGVVDRCEVVGMVDVATRSITAAVLRPTTKSVDAALLLARPVTPAPMRPGWPEALRMEHSVAPAAEPS